MSKAEYAYEIVYVNADAGCGAFEVLMGIEELLVTSVMELPPVE